MTAAIAGATVDSAAGFPCVFVILRREAEAFVMDVLYGREQEIPSMRSHNLLRARSALNYARNHDGRWMSLVPSFD